MLSAQKLRELSDMQLADADKAALTDVDSIELDPHIQIEARFAKYLSEIKNPFLFRCGDIKVKITYSDTDVTIDDSLSVYLSHLKSL